AARRAELVRVEREAYVERLAVTRVLDERGALDDTLATRDGVSAQTVRETLETARALESLRDGGACRNCGRRGDPAGHLPVPRSRGGSDAIATLALVCARCHRKLEPHGPYRLTGNPNLPGASPSNASAAPTPPEPNHPVQRERGAPRHRAAGTAPPAP